MRENSYLLNKLDWATIGIYLMLVFVGWISVYAAVYNEESRNILDLSQRYGMQAVWIASALLLAVLVLIIDSKFYPVFANIIYAGIILLLALVLVVGTEVNGSRSWLILGPLRLQPAELAKVATSLALARLMGAQGFVLKRKWAFFKTGLIIGLPMFFIFLQHDTGSALVFGSFLIMLYREGLSGWIVNSIIFAVVVFILSILWQPVSVLMLCVTACLIVLAVCRRRITSIIAPAVSIFAPYFIIVKWLLPAWDIQTPHPDRIFLAICITAMIAGGIHALRHRLRYLLYILCFFTGSVALAYSVDHVFDNMLKPHQRQRIENLLGLKEDLKGAGYNVHQSMVAIGSGGFTGKGFLQGTQTKYNFVPEQSTDFIFCTIGEEWGFTGSLVVVMCYLLLLVRLVLIAERQKSAFARIYAYCVLSILFFHFAVNVGMTIGLAPVVGIPLPFISYGGSSLWAFTILLFILLKMDAVRWD
ncbi:MAG: rod shape-determining protein RodA [Prevotellaceae bacterium]|jgi:rod shape determining protein RodA|nr:rod shape-determining protein RodA [Prevotellaceae bacterium]